MRVNQIGTPAGKVYVAGKGFERARLVMAELRKRGYLITYDWTFEYSEEGAARKAELELEGVRAAQVLVYLWEADQESARYEAGMAMGLGTPVVVAGYGGAFFFLLAGVTCVGSDQEIYTAVARVLGEGR